MMFDCCRWMRLCVAAMLLSEIVSERTTMATANVIDTTVATTSQSRGDNAPTRWNSSVATREITVK